MYKEYNYNNDFKLESGYIFKGITISYHTYGELNESCDNVIWVCHALTANSDVADWWPNTVSEGRFLDPSRYFIVCANFLGSQYGTTGALSIDKNSGEPYFDNFPLVTVRDMVNAHIVLAKHLGIKSLFALMGSSLGGFQAMEWAIMEPDFCKKLILIATASRAMPWVTALNESQRMAIMCDSTYGEKHPRAGEKGLKTARSIALLSYRGQQAYDLTQTEIEDVDKVNGFRASSYQRHQGNKLAARFSAYTYYSITCSLDTHNVGRGRLSRELALGMIKADCCVITVSSDILFPPSEHKYMVEHIEGAYYSEIDSIFGHDGFLVESDKLNSIILKHYNK